MKLHLPVRALLRRAAVRPKDFLPLGSSLPAGPGPVERMHAVSWTVFSTAQADLVASWAAIAAVTADLVPSFNLGDAPAGSAAAFRAIASTTYAARTNTTISVPTGTQDNDVLVLMHIAGGATPVTPTAPGGWTLFSGFPSTITSAGFSVTTRLYWRRASSEPASYTFTHANGSSQAVMVAVSGASASAAPAATVNTGTGATITALALPANEGDWVGLLAHNWDLWGTGVPPAGDTPTYTERLDAADSLIYVAEGVMPSTVTTGDETMGSLGSGSTGWSGILVRVPSSLAVPAIAGATQNVNTLSITGTSFGAAPPTPLLWDDFESGTAGQPLAANPQVGSWNVVGPTTYNTAQKHGGTQSAYAVHTTTAQWANFDLALPVTSKLYQSFWFRYNYPAGGTGQSKLSQIHGSSGQGDFAPGVMTGGLAGDWWASYVSTESGANDVDTRRNFTEPAHNVWHHFELIALQSTPNTADGRVIIRVDGAVVYHMPAVETRETSARWDLMEFFEGMTNFSSNSETWLDECYASTSWARVELGDAATYGACTKKSIQPVTSWSATSIDCTVNRGEFTASSTVYVYVTDENGRTNPNGYALVLA